MESKGGQLENLRDGLTKLCLFIIHNADPRRGAPVNTSTSPFKEKEDLPTHVPPFLEEVSCLYHRLLKNEIPDSELSDAFESLVSKVLAEASDRQSNLKGAVPSYFEPTLACCYHFKPNAFRVWHSKQPNLKNWNHLLRFLIEKIAENKVPVPTAAQPS